MKINLFYFLACLLLLTACGEDEEPVVTVAEFQYDGENNTAPNLDPGEHILAARYPASIAQNYQGKTLDRVEFYLVNVPSLVELRVYGAGDATSPGDLLYSADLSNDLRANSWNGHLIPDGVAIDGTDIWIAIRVIHNSLNNSVGCDFGPAKANGDWILTESGTPWQTFRNLTGNQSSINWNIRGFVD